MGFGDLAIERLRSDLSAFWESTGSVNRLLNRHIAKSPN
jgi:hypothetical protein